MNVHLNYAYTGNIVKILAYVVDLAAGILFFWIRRSRRIHLERIKKILIVKLDHLGDSFLITPILNYLNISLPVRVDVLCQELTKPVFENNPFIGNIVTFNYFRSLRGEGKKAGFKDTVRLIKHLRDSKYDLFIDARGEPFVSLMGLLTGSKYRVGFEKEEIGGALYTHPLKYKRNEHETKKYAIILDALGIKAKKWHPEIYLTENERVKVDKMMKELFSKPIIALHAGAGVSYKMWPLDNFAVLVKRIEGKYDYQFALIGGNGDKSFAEKLLHMTQSKKICNLTGKVTIREVYYFLSKIKIFVGNDSILAHFAGSLNIPVIETMNGMVNKDRWKALGDNVSVMSGYNKEHKCLLDKCKYPCPHMQMITVEEVFDRFALSLKKS